MNLRKSFILLVSVIFHYLFLLTPAMAVVHAIVQDEFDDFATIRDCENNENVLNLKVRLDSFKGKLKKLSDDEIREIFGKSQPKPPKTYAFPVFEDRGVAFGGLGYKSSLPTIFFPIGNLGAVERYAAIYVDGQTLVTWLVYCRANEEFMPLRSKGDLPTRLEWDKNCLKELESWYADKLQLHNTKSEK